jgi:hypothetical protein
MQTVKSGTLDQVLHFYVGSSPFLSSFTVKQKRGPNAAVVRNTPTITVTEDGGVPGFYALLLNQDMTITAGKKSELVSFIIDAAGMTTQFKQIELRSDYPADALNVDSYTEPTGIPPLSASIAAKVNWLYKALRGRIEINKNTGKKIFFNDDASPGWSKALGDDGTTYSEDKAAGP